jgi:hypothetical protein
MAAACLACHKTIACSGLNLTLLERSKMGTSSNRISNLNAIVEHFASQIISKSGGDQSHAFLPHQSAQVRPLSTTSSILLTRKQLISL